ncbi:hypothetical protein [Streptomyces sp. A5-4]|uniref:hypothetical protein n=1 Tax=Streptomyces sp. A5-4 TaxID=3384771 RepID=UPI003DA96ED0
MAEQQQAVAVIFSGPSAARRATPVRGSTRINTGDHSTRLWQLTGAARAAARGAPG